MNDDIAFDLMAEACGVSIEDAVSGIEMAVLGGVPIAFAGTTLILRMMINPREKDFTHRAFPE